MERASTTAGDLEFSLDLLIRMHFFYMFNDQSFIDESESFKRNTPEYLALHALKIDAKLDAIVRKSSVSEEPKL